MESRRFLTLDPDNDPLRVQLSVSPVGEHWRSVIVADGVPPPGPDEVNGIGFYADMPDEPQRLAKAYRGLSEPVN